MAVHDLDVQWLVVHGNAWHGSSWNGWKKNQGLDLAREHLVTVDMHLFLTGGSLNEEA